MDVSAESNRQRITAHALVLLTMLIGTPAMRSPWGRRKPVGATAEGVDPVDQANPVDGDPIEPDSSAAPGEAADLQVFAHTMIANLFGAGLRIQNLMSSAPDELVADLESVADQIDDAIREMRQFAFTHRS